MKNRSGHIAVECILVVALKRGTSRPGQLLLRATPQRESQQTRARSQDVLLSTMQQEMQRAQTSLGKLDPAPYFVSYSVYDQSMAVVVGSEGSLVTSTEGHRRTADVSMRIGTAALDNAHGENRASASISGTLPLEDDRDAIAHELWRLTYEEYRKASEEHT